MALICRKFDSIAESDQSIPASGFAPKRMNKRTVSAPNFSIINSGLTVLPRLLLIFADLNVNASPQVGHGVSLRSTCSSTLQDAQYGVGALTIPWQTNREKGSDTSFSPASLNALVKNRAYNKCMTACSIPPIYRSTPPSIQ